MAIQKMFYQEIDGFMHRQAQLQMAIKDRLYQIEKIKRIRYYRQTVESNIK